MFGYASRSITAIFTSLYLLLSVGACADRRQEEAFAPAPDVAEPPAQTSVTILHADGEVSLAFQQALDRYAEQRGGDVTFQVQAVSGRENYRSALRARLLSGESADLFHILDVSDVDRLGDYLEDLSALSWLEGAYDGSLEPVTIGGGVYGAPHSLEGVGLIVRRDIFEAAGIPLGGINSFESLSDAFGELRDQIASGELEERFPDLVAVTDIPAQDLEYLSTSMAEVLLWGAFQSPQQAFYSATADFPGSEEAEGLVKLLGRFSPQSSNWGDMLSVTRSKAVAGGIAAGRVAAVLDSTEAVRQIALDDPDTAAKLSFLPLYYENSEEGVVLGGPSAWWAVNKDADDSVKEAVYDLLSWLYDSAEGAQVLAESFGLASPYDTAGDSLSLHRQLRGYLEDGLGAPRLAHDAPAGWGEEVFAVQLQEYFYEYTKTWEELVQACVEGWSDRRDL